MGHMGSRNLRPHASVDLQVPDFLCDRTLERSIQTNITNGAQEVYYGNLSLLQLDILNNG